MRILYGTTNPAKLAAMKRSVEPLGIELFGLRDITSPIPQVDESGKSPLDNAILKAEAYYKALGIPVFSCDSGLYFDGLDDSLQPGTHIRRVNGKELDDEQMIEYYSSLAKSHGGSLVGCYRNAVCFIIDERTRFTSMDESLSGKRFILTEKPHKKRIAGFPLDSLSVNIESGLYYYDITEASVEESAVGRGFRAFFDACLKDIL